MRFFKETLPKFLKKRNKTVVVVGALIVFVGFVLKDGLRERWQKRAEAMDTAEYMYSLSAVEADNNVSISLVLARLDQLKEQIGKAGTKKEAPISGEQVINYAGALSENERLKNILTTTLILAQRLPELEDLKKECEEYRSALETARGELEFLRFLYLPAADKFLKERRPWSYAPKRPLETYHLHLNPFDPSSKETAVEAVIKSDEQTFDLLRQDVEAFKNETAEKARKIRESDEWWSKAATVGTTILFVLGWALAFAGKYYEVPTFSAESD
jgi:hypothetical protein